MYWTIFLNFLKFKTEKKEPLTESLVNIPSCLSSENTGKLNLFIGQLHQFLIILQQQGGVTVGRTFAHCSVERGCVWIMQSHVVCPQLKGGYVPKVFLDIDSSWCQTAFCITITLSKPFMCLNAMFLSLLNYYTAECFG